MITESDIRYLKKSGCSEYVIRHSIAVARNALDIADTVKIVVDRSLIKLGAIHHDIGRTKTQGIDHAVIGAEIGREIGLDERVVGIIENHIGAGILEAEAGTLGLPLKDYIPRTPEEIIVSYSDNLLRGDRVESFKASVLFFKRNLGVHHAMIDRFIAMHELIVSWQ
jgi:uncharacterized protein